MTLDEVIRVEPISTSTVYPFSRVSQVIETERDVIVNLGPEGTEKRRKKQYKHKNNTKILKD